MLYEVVRDFIRYVIINGFFQNVEVIGAHNIPDGPLILVGNHQNQFIDAASIIACLPRRKIHFLIAAKSLSRPVIGQLAKIMGSIPVERGQDQKTDGEGRVSSIFGSDLFTFSAPRERLRGILNQGAKFSVKFEGRDQILTVKEIYDDAGSVSVSCMEKISTSYSVENATFQIFPKMENAKMYEAVFEALKQGSCIGIFPEGGSHDNVGKLLDLKPGTS